MTDALMEIVVTHESRLNSYPMSCLDAAVFKQGSVRVMEIRGTRSMEAFQSLSPGKALAGTSQLPVPRLLD